jgi:alkylhydroperoxidase/carboxymuconolactone decarboxylase family protein YurZ
MRDIDRLVPGFEEALARLPGTLGAYAELANSLDRGTLSPRSRAEIGLIVAARVRCEYSLWVMQRLAAHQGMNEEDILFASMGIARGRREAAIARLARLMVSGAEIEQKRLSQHPDARLFNPAELAEIIAQVAMAVLTCTVLQGIAPRPIPARREA